MGGHRHAPAALSGIHFIGGWVGPRVGLDGCGISRPPPGYKPQTVKTIASRCTDCAIPTYLSTNSLFFFPVALQRDSGSWCPLMGLRDHSHWTHHLTTYNNHKGQTSMSPAGFEAAIPASVWPQTHALNRAATGLGINSHGLAS